jgi:hypothetical protein
MGKPHQLRSALAVRAVEPEALVSAAIELELPVLLPLVLGVLEALEPELMVPDEAAPEAEVLPEVLPCAAAPALPPGVPVVPIGVFCVLRWPAPTAGSEAGCGGVLCANARLKVAAAAAAMTYLMDM